MISISTNKEKIIESTINESANVSDTTNKENIIPLDSTIYDRTIDSTSYIKSDSTNIEKKIESTIIKPTMIPATNK